MSFLACPSCWRRACAIARTFERGSMCWLQLFNLYSCSQAAHLSGGSWSRGHHPAWDIHDDSTATLHPVARCERDTELYPRRVAGAHVTIGMLKCKCEARVAAAGLSALKLACLLAWLPMGSFATSSKVSDHSYTDPNLIHIVVPTECNEYQSWQVSDQVLWSLKAAGWCIGTCSWL